MALCERSIEDNVYYSPKYALALLDTVERRKVSILTLWQGDTMVALLPTTHLPLGIPGLFPSSSGWGTLYTFNGMPILDGKETRRVAAALVDCMARTHGGDWIIPQVNVGGPAFDALTGAFLERGIPWQVHSPFERAMLAAGMDYGQHLDANVSSKRQRDLARSRRKLEEIGRVSCQSHTSGPGLQRAVLAFLELEAKGWKGRRGTALACRDDTREFALRAFASDEEGQCRADVLMLDDNPVAVGIMVLSGKTAFTVKGAYDEAYARCSAGLLLELEVLKSFLGSPWADKLDSATAGKHVIDEFWPERQQVANLAFSFSKIFPSQRLSVMQASSRIQTRARARIKHWLGRE